jgi:two-component system NtrC family sensor kinase
MSPPVQASTPGATRALYGVLAAAVLLPLLLFLWSSWSSYREHFSDAAGRLSNVAEIAAEHGKYVLETHRLIIQQIDQLLEDLPDDEIRRDERQLHGRLQFLAQSHDQVSAIYVFDADCRALVASAVYPIPTNITCNGREYARVHREGLVQRDASYVDLIHARVSGETVIVISRRRNTKRTDTFPGITSVSIEPSYFPNYFSRIAAMGFTTAALVREDGTILAHYPQIPAAAPRPYSNKEMMEAFRSATRSGTLRSFSPADRVWQQIAYRRLDGYRLYLAVGLDESAILAGWRAGILHDLVFGLPAAAALLLLTLFAVGRTRREGMALRRLQEESMRRRSAEEQLLHAQKMEAIGQLTGGIAHDINNLLMVVDGSVVRLRKEPTGEKALRSLDMIRTAVERGANLTRQLLSFSQRRTVQPTLIDICELLRQSKEMLARALPGEVELKFDLHEVECLAFVDRGEFELAILNLAVNARDAMPNGGLLEISVRLVALHADSDEHRLQGEFIAIALTDNGSGIAPEHLHRIFEPYFTTKELSRGTGLGLSQVYGFARQAGGDVRVKSQLQRGTTFIIYLPRASGVVPSQTINVQPITEKKGDGRKVLLVEDDSDVAEVTKGMLEELGYSVVWVASAEEAIEQLNSNQKFDHIVSDIVMPGGMGGVELAKSVRAQFPNMPVLLITGYSGRAQEIVQEGFTVLKKPFTMRALAAGLQPEDSRQRHAE